MRKYRMCYNNVFTIKSDCILKYDGGNVSKLAIFFEYRIFNRRCEELLFTCDDGVAATEQFWNDIPLSDYFQCEYDKDSDIGYNIKPICDSNDNFLIKPFVNSCQIYINDNINPQYIPYSIFCSMLKENPQCFDHIDNHPTLSAAWGSIDV